MNSGQFLHGKERECINILGPFWNGIFTGFGCRIDNQMLAVFREDNTLYTLVVLIACFHRERGQLYRPYKAHLLYLRASGRYRHVGEFDITTRFGLIERLKLDSFQRCRQDELRNLLAHFGTDAVGGGNAVIFVVGSIPDGRGYRNHAVACDFTNGDFVGMGRNVSCRNFIGCSIRSESCPNGLGRHSYC